MTKKSRTSPLLYIAVFVFSLVAGYFIHKSIPVAGISQIANSPMVTFAGTITKDDYDNYLIIGIEDPDDFYFLQGSALTPDLVGKDFEVSGYPISTDADVPVLETLTYKPYQGQL